MDLIIADEETQRWKIEERIRKGRYNGRYKEIREENRPEYLKVRYKGRDQSLIDHSWIASSDTGMEEKGDGKQMHIMPEGRGNAGSYIKGMRRNRLGREQKNRRKRDAEKYGGRYTMDEEN